MKLMGSHSLRSAVRQTVPLDQSALCLDCESVFHVGHSCPRCASDHWAPLARFLNRDVQVAAAAV